jgi:hypothetical protein
MGEGELRVWKLAPGRVRLVLCWNYFKIEKLLILTYIINLADGKITKVLHPVKIIGMATFYDYNTIP